MLHITSSYLSHHNCLLMNMFLISFLYAKEILPFILGLYILAYYAYSFLLEAMLNNKANYYLFLNNSF